MHVVERVINGRKYIIECGKMAKQANGSVLVRCEDSAVLVTACSGEKKSGDFLPLTIDYLEKTYAAGRIPGSFFKREGKVSERETLISRLMDRPCRPLFPERFNTEVQVIGTVVSADEDFETDVLAVCGASAALTVSDLPFEGPLAAVRVGRIGGKYVINPGASQMKDSDMNYIVAGTRDAIVMVEGGSKEVPESDVLEALFYAHQEMQPLIEMQEELRRLCGKPKLTVEVTPDEPTLVEAVKKFLKPRLDEAIRIKEKLVRRDAVSKIKDDLRAEFIKEGAENAEELEGVLERLFEDNHYHAVRGMVFKEGKRIDGRDTRTVRPISIELGLLPRTHGSALFTRGETQALVVTTLGMMEDAQRLDTLIGEDDKHFMLHYNFPPYSVGETKPLRGPGRREVGHGALAERAVKMIMPDTSKFPYVVRVVSEILESNGSSSMASVCGSSLSLMDAGVPTAAPVAGVAMGLMKEGEQTVILTDILGDEDHLGDMDFKVCGTEKGVTALQMDIKIKGLDKATVDRALKQAYEGRLHILGEMKKAITAPRKSLSNRAPKIVTIKINPDKIRDLIGPGGKMIRSISESCGVKIDVTDDGTVNVAAADDGKVKSALAIIESLTAEAEIGKIYKGIVKRITEFGAFVEIMPGTDGLVHISQLADKRVQRVEDIVREGDEIHVKVIDVDRQGKIRLSLKEALAEMQQQG